eukprot:CAMPEP_0172509520 /NCGR_PEP_ID=MMETSP1066-20121228/221007_1 /TAXON_ID=671091 /ORGANISM="Coscinodiscus wailesii, Strain CCMP2513" /LENGTH=46 /DNA_ID= /DNA_START= /DNA_END= /DNA_ORIENTATION=
MENFLFDKTNNWDVLPRIPSPSNSDGRHPRENVTGAAIDSHRMIVV